MSAIESLSPAAADRRRLRRDPAQPAGALHPALATRFRRRRKSSPPTSPRALQYERGGGVTLDYVQALTWYRKAADAGYRAGGGRRWAG